MNGNSRFERGSVSLPFAISVAFFCATVSAQTQAIDTAPIEQEIAAMSEVLEQNIPARFRAIHPRGRDGDRPRYFHSVRGRYIPTVGVIFTVPVSIPLRSTARHSNTGERPPAPERSEDRSSARYEVKKRRQGDASTPKTVEGKPARVADEEETDADTLRTSLLSVIASHGHRLSHLDDDERVLVIVEADVAGTARPASEWESTARYQIAVRKRDLTAEMSPETLAAAAEETHY
jgi:hypothetical protein